MTSAGASRFTLAARETLRRLFSADTPEGVAAEERTLVEHLGVTDIPRWGLDLLDIAIRSRDNDLLNDALLVGFHFGFLPEHADLLNSIAFDEWHTWHEDLVEYYVDVLDPSSVPILLRYTEWIPEYMREDDEFSVLAVKAVWCLSKIGTPDAKAVVRELTSSSNDHIRHAACKQLEIWGET